MSAEEGLEMKDGSESDDNSMVLSKIKSTISGTEKDNLEAETSAEIGNNSLEDDGADENGVIEVKIEVCDDVSAEFIARDVTAEVETDVRYEQIGQNIESDESCNEPCNASEKDNLEAETFAEIENNSLENETADENGVRTVNIEVCDDVETSMAYRNYGDGSAGNDTDSGSDSDSSTSSGSGIEVKPEPVSDGNDEEDSGKKEKKKNLGVDLKTRGEIYPEELPPLEDLKISVDENEEMQEIGLVSSSVGVLVVVQGNSKVPPLSDDTVLFTADRQSFGKIFEVFGPVACPFYSVRFNSPEDITERNVVPGLPLYCAPHKEEYTHFIFVNELKRMKGSDASWEHNNEPPTWCMDYSDDEEEKRVKAKNRNKASAEKGTDEQTSGKKSRNKKQDNRNDQKVNGNQEVSHQRQHNQMNQGGGRGQGQCWPPNQGRGASLQPQNFWSSNQQNQGMAGMSFQPQQASNCNFQQSWHGPRMNTSAMSGQFRPPAFRGNMNGGQGRMPQNSTSSNFQASGVFQGQGYNMRPMCNPPVTNQITDTRFIQNTEQNMGFNPNGIPRQQQPRSTFGGQPQFSEQNMGFNTSGFPRQPQPRSTFGGQPQFSEQNMGFNPNGIPRQPQPRSTFGGQPQFSPGPMNPSFNAQRPMGRGVSRFSGVPTNRW